MYRERDRDRDRDREFVCVCVCVRAPVGWLVILGAGAVERA
jgi:hypothetical protein